MNKQSAAKIGSTPWYRNQPFTDLGNARTFAAHHGQDICYCSALRKWLTWDGSRWVADEIGEIERKAKATVVRMAVEATKIKDDERRTQALRYAFRCQSAYKIKAMINLAQSEPGIAIRTSDLDANAWQLNVLNGTLDLKTGKLRPHERRDLITKIVAVPYDPAAKCPVWEQFISEIMDGNVDAVLYLQKAIGYSLTGSTSEQVIFVLHGPGANGKSTFHPYDPSPSGKLCEKRHPQRHCSLRLATRFQMTLHV